MTLTASLAVHCPACVVMGHPQWMRAKKNAAGESSRRKYNELMKTWHRRNRALFILLGLACASVVMGSLVLARVFPGQAWAAGFIGGLAATLYLTLRWTGPGWIENWQVGMWGEQSTAKALRPLERAGWVVLHDLPTATGNVDHIVVGPGGVFLLDSKRLGGCAVFEGGILTVHRFGDSELTYTHPGPGHLLGLARETHDRVKADTRINVWVAPVMVMWGEFPQRRVDDRVVYVHGEDLVDLLSSQPSRVAPARVPQLADAVRSAWQREVVKTS